MNSLLTKLLLASATLLPTACFCISASTNAPLVISNINVIDVVKGEVLEGRDVFISNNQITDIRPAQKALHESAHLIDGSGKFLIPGLWDMHLHMGDRTAYLSLYVANGITGIRDTGGSLGPIKAWREQIRKGELLGPQIYAAGPIVDGDPPIWPDHFAVMNDATARDAVRTLKERGADFVKVYIRLKKADYFTVIDEANQQGLPVAGHLPDDVTVAEAVKAGQKSIEHFGSGLFLIYCSTNETGLLKELEAVTNSGLSVSERIKRRIRIFAKAADSYDEKKAGELIDMLVRSGTWQVPTRTIMSFMFRSRSLGAIDGAYVPTEARKYWVNNPFLEDFPEDDMRLAQYADHKQMELMQKMNKAGVNFLAGTDSGKPFFILPGFALHEELDLLVQEGFTPAEALRTATLNPARYFDRTDIGRVAPDLKADLVILNGNPLEDINNTTRIDGVILQGKYLGRQKLDEMLADVKKAVAEEQMTEAPPVVPNAQLEKVEPIKAHWAPKGSD